MRVGTVVTKKSPEERNYTKTAEIGVDTTKGTEIDASKKDKK